MVEMTPRDLPPCPRAQVWRGKTTWIWVHSCPWHNHRVTGGGYGSWAEAFKAARNHMARCEAT